MANKYKENDENEIILKKKEDPGIYCVLGEILNKEEYFFKALEISEKIENKIQLKNN